MRIGSLIQDDRLCSNLDAQVLCEFASSFDPTPQVRVYG